jgi:hypothetical protein
MIDKFIYKLFAAIDEGFAWVDNSFVAISLKWRKIKMWKFIKKLWKRYVNWLFKEYNDEKM